MMSRRVLYSFNRGQTFLAASTKTVSSVFSTCAGLLPQRRRLRPVQSAQIYIPFEVTVNTVPTSRLAPCSDYKTCTSNDLITAHGRPRGSSDIPMLVAANSYAASSSDSFDDAVGGCSRRASVGSPAGYDRLAGGRYNERFADCDSGFGRRGVSTWVGVYLEAFGTWRGSCMSSGLPTMKSSFLSICPRWGL